MSSMPIPLACSNSLVLASAILIVVAGCRKGDDNGLPLTIVASTSGGMQLDTCWFLSVNSSRRASLAIGHSDPEIVEFTIPKSEFDAVRKLIEGYHSWDDVQYLGSSAPDEVVRKLTLSIGSRSLIMSFHSLEDIPYTSRVSIERFIILRHRIRSWIDPYEDRFDMMDLRDYELRCLENI